MVIYFALIYILIFKMSHVLPLVTYLLYLFNNNNCLLQIYSNKFQSIVHVINPHGTIQYLLLIFV